MQIRSDTILMMILFVPAMVMNSAGLPNREYNQDPMAVNDTVHGPRKDEWVIFPWGYDTDADADPLRISGIINEPAGREFKGTDRSTYHIPDTTPGSDEIVYEIIDFQGGASNA